MIYTTTRPKDLQFSVADETVLQKCSDKVAKMLITLVNHRHKQSIISYLSAL